MSAGAALMASFLVTMGRPATWPLALAAFLVRGGIVLVLAPIVVIPSAIGMANVLAPALTTLVYTGDVVGITVLVGGSALAVLSWLVVGGLVGALIEAELVGIVATDEEVVADPSHPPVTNRGIGNAARILAARLIAFIPLAIALAWGATRLVSVAYRELTNPSSTDTPLIGRVASGAPDALLAIALTWLVGGMVGSIAARRLVLEHGGAGRAVLLAVGRLLRHPIRSIAIEGLPLLALLLVLFPSAAAAATVWEGLRAALATGSGPVIAIVVLLLFVGLWAGGLVLIGAVSAWRAAVWTVELAGTFGASLPGRAGDWNSGPESGTLADLRPRGADPDTR
jgi:hypothetical protein